MSAADLMDQGMIYATEARCSNRERTSIRLIVADVSRPRAVLYSPRDYGTVVVNSKNEQSRNVPDGNFDAKPEKRKCSSHSEMSRSYAGGTRENSEVLFRNSPADSSSSL